MVYGDYEDLLPDDSNLYVYTRTWEGTRWLILLNHSEAESKLTLPAELSYKPEDSQLILANYPDIEAEDTERPLSLRPYEARIYQS